MLYAEKLVDSDDLSTDSGVQRDVCLLYALRPSSVRAALERFDAVPWNALSRISEKVVGPDMTGNRYVPDYGAFETVLHQHRGWAERRGNMRPRGGRGHQPVRIDLVQHRRSSAAEG
jgi:hypothetical protein